MLNVAAPAYVRYEKLGKEKHSSLNLPAVSDEEKCFMMLAPAGRKNNVRTVASST